MSKFLDKDGLQHYDEKIKAYVDSKSGSVNPDFTSHIGNKKNPHEVTKEQVGLGNVTNVAQIPLSQKGAASGVATLGTDGKLTAAQLPAMKTVNGVSVVGSGNISIDLSLYKVVDTLPTTNIDATKIYIVPAEKTDDNNIKVEYIYTGDPASAYDASKWEKLGDAQTNIVVDAELSATSTNPVQNKVVYGHIDFISTTFDEELEKLQNKNTEQDTAIDKKLDKSAYVVDVQLSSVSTNPIQNRAVQDAVNSLNTSITGINGSLGDLSSRISEVSAVNTKQDSAIKKCINSVDTNSSSVIHKNEHISSLKIEGQKLVATWDAVVTPEDLSVELSRCVKTSDLVAITNDEIDAMF